MIGFVNWSPLYGQVTKSIILVKICYKLLYVIQGVKIYIDKVTSQPQLISAKFLVACNVASVGHNFYAPGVFV